MLEDFVPLLPHVPHSSQIACISDKRHLRRETTYSCVFRPQVKIASGFWKLLRAVPLKVVVRGISNVFPNPWSVFYLGMGTLTMTMIILGLM